MDDSWDCEALDECISRLLQAEARRCAPGACSGTSPELKVLHLQRPCPCLRGRRAPLRPQQRSPRTHARRAPPLCGPADDFHRTGPDDGGASSFDARAAAAWCPPPRRSPRCVAQKVQKAYSFTDRLVEVNLQRHSWIHAPGRRRQAVARWTFLPQTPSSA